MVIAILVLVIGMFVFSVGVMIYMIISTYKERKQKTINKEKILQEQKENKEFLSTSRSSKKCAEVCWNIVNNATTTLTVNARKSNYSDERESCHFSKNLTDKRLALMNEIDGECEYGRY